MSFYIYCIINNVSEDQTYSSLFCLTRQHEHAFMQFCIFLRLLFVLLPFLLYSFLSGLFFSLVTLFLSLRLSPFFDSPSPSHILFLLSLSLPLSLPLLSLSSLFLLFHSFILFFSYFFYLLYLSFRTNKTILLLTKHKTYRIQNINVINKILEKN